MAKRGINTILSQTIKIFLVFLIVQLVTSIGIGIPIMGPSSSFASQYWDGRDNSPSFTKDAVLNATIMMPENCIGNAICDDGDGAYYGEGNEQYDYIEKLLGPFPTYEEIPFSIIIPEGTYITSFLTVEAMGAESFPDTFINVDEVEMTVASCFDIEARAKRGKVALTWDNQAEITRYDIYRSIKTSPSNFVKIAETTSTYSAYIDYNVQNETTYLYVVGVIRGEGEACFSNIISAYPTSVRSRGTINYDPVIYTSPITIGSIDIDYNYQIKASDPNNDFVIYELSSSPEGMIIDENGRITWTPTLTGTFSVTVNAIDNNGGSDTQSFEINVENPYPVPDAEISWWADSGEGIAFYLEWHSKYGETCYINQEIGDVGPNGSLYIGSPNEVKTYTITVTGPGGSHSESVVVTPYPEITVNVEPYPANIPPGDSVTLTWETQFASSCRIEPDIGQVDLNGSIIITPEKTQWYQIIATNPAGSVSAWRQIVINPPIIEFTASPENIGPNGSSLLTWSSTNAHSCTIEPDIGEVDLNGSLTVTPNASTTYTLTSTGAGGSVTGTARVAFLPPEAELTTSSENIILGESITLTWVTNNAVSCTIEPDIGGVDLNGSFTVHPTESTTYTLSATGHGSVSTSTITVLIPAPEISFNAAPAIIQSGDSSILAWNTTNTTSCSIEPGIGPVDINGTVTVFPTENTTYTLTATGPEGVQTADITINILPAVQISADPVNIKIGQPVTLSWSSIQANTCVIEPGNIVCETLNGSIELNPVETTAYTITATNNNGITNANVTVEVHNPFTVQITSPQAGEDITRPDVMVWGTFTNTDNVETGITVNGVTAIISGNQFVANHVDLQNGENILTITAVDFEGGKYAVSMTVNADISQDYIRILSNPYSGTVPLQTDLIIDGSFSIPESTITYSGPGTVEFISENIDQYEIEIDNEGIHYLTAEVLYNGAAYTDTTAIEVLDKDALGIKLNIFWNGMKSEINNGNVEGALNYFSGYTYNKYKAAFENMDSSLLPLMASTLQEINIIYATNQVAKFRMYQPHEINGETTNITFFVYMTVDETGLWKISQF